MLGFDFKNIDTRRVSDISTKELLDRIKELDIIHCAGFALVAEACKRLSYIEKTVWEDAKEEK